MRDPVAEEGGDARGARATGSGGVPGREGVGEQRRRGAVREADGVADSVHPPGARVRRMSDALERRPATPSRNRGARGDVLPGPAVVVGGGEGEEEACYLLRSSRIGDQREISAVVEVRLSAWRLNYEPAGCLGRANFSRRRLTPLVLTRSTPPRRVGPHLLRVGVSETAESRVSRFVSSSSSSFFSSSSSSSPYARLDAAPTSPHELGDLPPEGLGELDHLLERDLLAARRGSRPPLALPELPRPPPAVPHEEHSLASTSPSFTSSHALVPAEATPGSTSTDPATFPLPCKKAGAVAGVAAEYSALSANGPASSPETCPCCTASGGSG